MKLLIVDDEVSSIITVSNMIDKEKLSIGQCFTAESVKEAKRHLIDNQIDIVLCDIEMPQESGLELLEWIKEKQLTAECIIMTCYAEFEYAKKAVSLGSVAYILKPIDKEELDKELQNAIHIINNKNQIKQINHSWTKNQDTIREKFWTKLFSGEIISSRISIRQWLANKSVSINLDWIYCPILFVTRKWGKNIKEEDHNLYRFAMKNIISELFMDNRESTLYDIIQISKDVQLVVIGGVTFLGQDKEKCNAICKQYLRTVKDYFGVDINCYLGKKATLWEVANEIECLYQMDYNNLWNEGVYDSNDYFRMSLEKKLILDLNEFENWLKQLINGEYRGVEKSIVDYLDYHTKTNGINREWLISFQRQYMVMLGAYAVLKKFYLNQIIENEEIANMVTESERGISELKKWIDFSLKAVCKLEYSNFKNNDPIEITKSYIEEHLADELDMEALAQNVYLNPDYLTRIFRKATGEPVNKYIINQRMIKAKQLLEYTNQPISEIAFQIGYNNYTSFNRIFTKSVGLSPQIYRLNYRK